MFTEHSRRIYGCFTDASRVPHGCFTGISWICHGYFTDILRLFYGSLTVRNQFFRFLTQFFEFLMYSSHRWFTVDSRVIHGGLRVMDHGYFTACFGLLMDVFYGLWAAVKGDSKQWNWYQDPWNSTKWGNDLQLFSQ